MQQEPHFYDDGTPADQSGTIATTAPPDPLIGETCGSSVDAEHNPGTDETTLCSTMQRCDWRGDLTFFDGINETRPADSCEALVWDAFTKRICPDEPIVVTDKKDAPYFLACPLHDAPLTGKTRERAQQNGEPTVGKMRSKDHVTESHVLIFDYDGIDGLDFEQVRGFLKRHSLTYIAYTTHSHGRDDKPGMFVRLCIPVDRPLDVDTYSAAWHTFVSLLPVAPDRTGSKLYQQQGAWACHPERKDQAQRWSHVGGVLSIGTLPLHAADKEPAASRAAPKPAEEMLQEFPPADADLVANRCKQIGNFRDSRGANQSEPRWNDSLGVVGHCVGGRKKGHEWSGGHPGYSTDETDRKLDHRLKVGPTTCAQFRKTNPSGCEGCTEQVTSPIVLGRPRSTTKPAPNEAPTAHTLFPSVEPHSEPVDPAELFDEIDRVIRRHVVMAAYSVTAVALWTVLAWLVGIALVLPLLLITAAERECGKSQLLALIAKFVPRPLTVSNMTAAFLFRAIEKWQPTLLIDEADTFMRESADQKGLINAGHTRDGAWVGRVVGDGHEPTKFAVFCPKGLAGIDLAKYLPDATMSRGIVISLRRKLPHEKCERLRYADSNQFALLQSKLARFAQDYAERIKNARPILPDALSDRQQDNWEPLFAIAECAGPEWLARCEVAALALSRAPDMSESSGNSLLGDIREIFERLGCDKIGSADLVLKLIGDEEAGWGTYNRGKPITPRQVARLLRPYGILPKTVRLGPGNTPKGYDQQQFDDAFTRYLAPAEIPDPAETDPPDATPAAADSFQV